ncbi:MAG TPA: hypothetical protein VFS42_02035 [Burkholderiaceae bacterium]|nr:hypothetical protein [Burkholderiaceae bacterium]
MLDAARTLRATHSTIATQAQAAAALDDVKRARARIEWLRYDREVECQQRFFASSCASQALAKQREALKQVRVVELEAEQRIRLLRDEAREQKRDEAKRRAEADAAALEATREQRQNDAQRRVDDRERRQTNFDRQAIERARNAEQERTRRQTREAEKARLERDAAQRAARVNENLDVYARKQREAKARQQERAERRRERAEKAKENSATPPATNPIPLGR